MAIRVGRNEAVAQEGKRVELDGRAKQHLEQLRKHVFQENKFTLSRVMIENLVYYLSQGVSQRREVRPSNRSLGVGSSIGCMLRSAGVLSLGSRLETGLRMHVLKKSPAELEEVEQLGRVILDHFGNICGLVLQFHENKSQDFIWQIGGGV